jgi:hypothetical protein
MLGICGLDSYDSGLVVGFCEHGNEHSSSIKGGEFDYLSDCLLLKKVCAPSS